MPCTTSVLVSDSVLLGAMFKLNTATVTLVIQLVCDGQRAADCQYKRVTEDVDCREATVSIDHKKVTDELLGHCTSHHVRQVIT